MTPAATGPRELAHPARDEIRLEGVLHALSDPMRLRVVRRAGGGRVGGLLLARRTARRQVDEHAPLPGPAGERRHPADLLRHGQAERPAPRRSGRALPRPAGRRPVRRGPAGRRAVAAPGACRARVDLRFGAGPRHGEPVAESTSRHQFRVLREGGVIRQARCGTAKLNGLRARRRRERRPPAAVKHGGGPRSRDDAPPRVDRARAGTPSGVENRSVESRKDASDMAYSRQSADTRRHYEHAETRAPREETAARRDRRGRRGASAAGGCLCGRLTVGGALLRYGGEPRGQQPDRRYRRRTARPVPGACTGADGQGRLGGRPAGHLADHRAVGGHGGPRGGAGVIWNNVATGAAVCVFGMAAAGATVAVRRSAPR